MKKILKQMAGFTATLLLLTVLMSGTYKKNSNISTKPENWVFTANQAMPQSGASKYLSGGYTVTYSSNKLTVYLPYYGRAYGGADVLSGKSPLDFTSTDFTVDDQNGKTGKRNINFKIKDNSEVRSMTLSWYDNGRAYLDVVLTNRSGISFNGTIVVSN